MISCSEFKKVLEQFINSIGIPMDYNKNNWIEYVNDEYTLYLTSNKNIQDYIDIKFKHSV